MLDENLNLFLIEVNYNPSLGIYGCTTLEQAINSLRNDVFNLTANKLF